MKGFREIVTSCRETLVGGKGRRRALGFSGGTKLAVPWPVEALGTADPTDNCVQRWSGVFYRSGGKPTMEIPVNTKGIAPSGIGLAARCVKEDTW